MALKVLIFSGARYPEKFKFPCTVPVNVVDYQEQYDDFHRRCVIADQVALEAQKIKRALDICDRLPDMLKDYLPVVLANIISDYVVPESNDEVTYNEIDRRRSGR